MRTFTDFNHLSRELNELIKELTSVETLRVLGERMVSDIRGRTRSGFGVYGNGNARTRLLPLKPLTVELREQKDLHPLTKPEKSNLTETGHMLDSLDYVIFGKGLGILMNNRFADDKVDWNENKGRYFLFLTKAEMTNVNRMLRDKRDQIISRLLS
jgi:hypothetical protein